MVIHTYVLNKMVFAVNSDLANICKHFVSYLRGNRNRIMVILTVALIYFLYSSFSTAFLMLFVGHVSARQPQIPLSEGKVWPMPQSRVERDNYMIIKKGAFNFTATKYNCDILDRAFQRYLKLIENSGDGKNDEISTDASNQEITTGILRSLEVILLSPCENYPYLHMDEKYNLEICNQGGTVKKARLVTSSIWGAIRGLETFTQLILETAKSSMLMINCTDIADFPRFPHRGFMLDTARHYLPVDTIKSALDLMGMDKLNVFHWHIVDDQSFPFVSETFPNLSKHGSWSDLHTYKPEVVQEIIDYARDRGVRVIVEFDSPGHSLSWGVGQPGLLTPCYSRGTLNGKFGPIDPSKEENFEFIRKLFTEVSETFPDHYLHLGADEVYLDCWKSNPEIHRFMTTRRIEGQFKKLEEYYLLKLIGIINKLPVKKRYIVWQEVFDNGVKIDNNTVVHIWKNENQPEFFYPNVAKATKSGYQVILSSCWYLNYISYGVDWHKYYDCDPTNFDGTKEQKRLVLGGEACMWGEFVDKTNLIARSWPRASTVAERLWSPAEKTKSWQAAASRLEEHRCRLLKRGYPVEPLGPSYCPGVL